MFQRMILILCIYDALWAKFNDVVFYTSSSSRRSNSFTWVISLSHPFVKLGFLLQLIGLLSVHLLSF